MAASEGSEVRLDDKFLRREGRVILSGVQALGRLLLLQAELDRAAGLTTGGFVSGYRGSPLGTVDLMLNNIAPLLKERRIEFLPAVNEDLGATAVWGSQQVGLRPGARVDGVFGLWYGKGPGLDRSGDALRHANSAGASRHGGVIVAIGDDHMGKSSSLAVCSDTQCAALNVPLFYPSDVGEVIRLGLHAYAASRFSGCYVGMKFLPEVADSTQVIDAGLAGFAPVLPEVEAPATGLNISALDTTMAILPAEDRQVRYRLPAIQAYVRANRLDRAMHRSATSRIGILAAGKSWLDVLEALRLLGIGEREASNLGVALYKPAMVWPLEPAGLREFAAGLETLLVVEEKGPFLEQQVRAALYDLPEGSRPAVLGKRSGSGAELLPAVADIRPEAVAAALGDLIIASRGNEEIARVVGAIRKDLDAAAAIEMPPVLRRPFFCSGCPHNTSTRVPEGSRALAGIGCHGMALWIMPETGFFSHMGAEGVAWAGQAPFTDERHVFANLGDGTYFHSGILAIRQSVAAGVNITYKLLYNGAVGMTGGQPVDGELSVPVLVEQLKAEGVGEVVIVADDPGRYDAVPSLKGKVQIEGRDELDRVQRELRDVPGVTVLVYDQMCASERRRLRKRGEMEPAASRVFINELVCEGCGDCSAKSNCLSVEPVETEFGRKRRINQSSCNGDYSCLGGFCPSFVTVEGGRPRKVERLSIDTTGGAVLPPPPPPRSERLRMVAAGIGGTGVVTIGAVLAMAAHLDGKAASVLDQTGLAQKGGQVFGFLHVAERDEDIAALRTTTGGADLVLACDQVVASSREVLGVISETGTRVIANANVAITADFTRNPSADLRADLLYRRLAQRAGTEAVALQPFSDYATTLFGDQIAANFIMVGYAVQHGLIPLSPESIERALKLNGTSVEMNVGAFRCGRLLAVDPSRVEAAAGRVAERPETLDDLRARRIEFLTAYQDAAYAESYAALVAEVERAEGRLTKDRSLTVAAARSLFKLMAYKDEYEVARLYTDGTFERKLRDQFDGDVRLTFHLAPPAVAGRDPQTGHLRKRAFGPWMMTAFRLLARLRRLRGTAFDPFGRTAERRMERRLAAEFATILREIAAGLTRDNLALAIRIAEMPMAVRGYGHIKDAAVAAYAAELGAALAQFRTPERQVAVPVAA